MDWINDLTSLVQGHEASILLTVSALILVLIITDLCLILKLGRLSKNRTPRTSRTGESPVGPGADLAARLERSEENFALLDERQKVQDERLARCVQKFGLVRFDAFPDVGGEQSFALALLDRELNGIVLSNLYGRSDSRVYAKEVTQGRSQHALSAEEQEALRRASACL